MSRPKTSVHAPAGPRLLTKKEVTDVEAIGPKLRRQIESHVLCLEARTSAKLEVVQEWHEYLKKRSEIEAEYGKSMDKLSDRTLEKLARLSKSGGKENVVGCSSTPLEFLQRVVSDGKSIAARHSLFSEDINCEVLPRLDIVQKDVSVANRRIREGMHTVHEEIKKAFGELLEAVKAYMAACIASDESQSKLTKIQASRSKGKNVDKDAKKEIKMLEGLLANKRKVIQTRNEYILHLDTFNKLAQAYFGGMSSSLFEIVDYEFHKSVVQVARLVEGLDEDRLRHHQKCIKQWRSAHSTLSCSADVATFKEANSATFAVPSELAFIPHSAAEKYELHAVDCVYENLTQQRETVAKTVKTVNSQLQETYRTLCELRESFAKGNNNAFGTSIDLCLDEETIACRSRVSVTNSLSSVLAPRREYHDTLYLAFNKMLELVVDLKKNYAVSDMLEDYLQDVNDITVKENTKELAKESVKADGEQNEKPMSHLDQYMMEHHNTIPPIVTSCIQYVEEHGTDVEGVFRVPGAVAQIEEMKEQFEDDFDPLYDDEEYGGMNYDIHAVASLLKQYLRDLAEPVFPYTLFQRFVDTQGIKDRSQRVAEITDILTDLPEGRYIVAREIMRFLDNFSGHALATKMNTNNLALVFGPTLLAPPPEMDAVTLARHTTTINLVTLTMVENRLEVFSRGPHTVVSTTVDPPPEEERLSRLELRKQEPLLYNHLEMSLMCPFFDDAPKFDKGISRSSIGSLKYLRRNSTVTDGGSSANVYSSPAKDWSSRDSRRRSASSASRRTSVSFARDPEPEVEVRPASEARDSIDSSSDPVEGCSYQPVYSTVHRPSLSQSVLQNDLAKTLAAHAAARETTSVSSLSTSPTVSVSSTTCPSPVVAAAPASPAVQPKSPSHAAVDSPTASLTSAQGAALHVQAHHSYAARTVKELSFAKGDVIDVYSKSPDGNWWDSSVDGKRGYIPVSYVKQLE